MVDLLHSTLNATEVIEFLELQPHPEGGHFRETFRDPEPNGKRGNSTAIYYLLAQDEISEWHQIDATEIWHWYAGAPLKLSISENNKSINDLILGPNLSNGQRPQQVVPRMAWQSATSLGAWTLVGCTVAPAFEFKGFELAGKNWQP